MASTPTAQAASPKLPAHPAATLLARAHSPTTASSIFTSRVRQKPLLLRPSSPPADKRALRRHVRLHKKAYYLRKQRPRPLSAKQKRELGVHALKKDEIEYSIYEGLHKLWTRYMWDVLGLSPAPPPPSSSTHSKTISATSHGSLLATADFHGAVLEVVRAKCVSQVGIKGIVVRDTKFTFVIVTPADAVKTVPKKGAVFRYEIPVPLPEEGAAAAAAAAAASEEDGDVVAKVDGRAPKLVFELHGSQFEQRAPDRANKKFKWKTMDYL